MITTPPVAGIIIPVRNEAHRLRPCLENAIEAARQRGWDLVVVDDCSTDNTAELAESLGVKVIRHERPRGAAAARNSGARGIQGDVLIFLDADVLAPPETLHTIADRLSEDDAIHGTGACPSADDLSSEWSAHFVALRAAWPCHRLDSSSVVEFSAVQSECGAIRRSVFEELGGFPENYTGVGMEEFALGHRMQQVGFVNVLLTTAYYRHHFKTLGRRCRELVRRTCRWVPLFLKRRRLESPAAVGSSDEVFSCLLSFAMICGVVLGAVYPIAWGIAALALVLQLRFEWRFLLFARQRFGTKMMLYAWPALQLYHAAIGLGFALGLLRLIVTFPFSRLDDLKTEKEE